METITFITKKPKEGLASDIEAIVTRFGGEPITERQPCPSPYTARVLQKRFSMPKGGVLYYMTSDDPGIIHHPLTTRANGIVELIGIPKDTTYTDMYNALIGLWQAYGKK